MEAPDLAQFRAYKVIDDIDLEGVVVPGLRGEFLSRAEGPRTATVGRYSYAGREVFRAWGYEGEEHCRYFAIVGPDGEWERPQAGCPRVRVLADDEGVAGLALHSSTGDWYIAPASGRRRPPLRPTAGSSARSGLEG
jgi:hypothetical protein